MSLQAYLSDTWRSAMDYAHGHHYLVTSILGIGFGYILIRQLLSGGPMRSRARMDGKVVLITGGNAGIGRATAEELMRRGARVIIACRDVNKGAAALREMHVATGMNSGTARLLDLASFESIRTFVEKFKKEEKTLDLLINNAGVICPQWKSKDGYEIQFAVNHLGHFLLTNLLLDVLKKSAPSRIITVSSKAYEMGRIDFDDLNSTNSWSMFGAYSNSKLANILFTVELARRLRGTGVTANCLHPGFVKTNIAHNMKKGDWHWLVRLLMTTVAGVMISLFANTPLQGSKTTIYCAVAPELETVSGKYFCDSRMAELAPQATDPDIAERLWNVSEEMAKLSKTE